MASIFRGLPTKQVTLLHQDGRVTPRQKSLINDKGNYIMIILEGDPDLIQTGDRIEYKDKDGMVDVYVVVDPGYHAKQFGVKPYFSAKVEKDGAYFQSASGQTYTRGGQTAPSSSPTGPSTQLLFDTLRTFVSSQEDKQTLQFLIGEMEASVGTTNYPAMYDSFIQTISGRIPQFAYFIPQLSHLLLESPR
ncbi:MAG: hypothetical protein J6I64_09250 [Lachnospiraceae bacterium]|nr:hypothetical protein [Lachnospiraceae bacterium]